MSERPIIGVTTGDPAGVGPEIVARAAADPSVRDLARLVVFGTSQVVERAIDLVGSDIAVRSVASPRDALFASGSIDVVDLAPEARDEVRPGVIQAKAGRASFEYVRAAIQAALDGSIAAIATAPINKESLRAGQVPYLDHTEMLGKLTGTENPLTLFVLDNLRVFFLTRHMSLSAACREITEDRVLEGLRQASDALASVGMVRPRLAVAALNPHAGDGGLFGSEDDEQVRPAVGRAREEGIDAYGPVPADSVFYQNRVGRFDAVLSLYHDQGHIATKTVDFERTVSLTMALPFIRSSVDHGTAFDIAWQGKASAIGMVEAIKVAVRYQSLLTGTRLSRRPPQNG